ncbi:unnamed protein product [Adineta steineri]|uniref:Apple domain-containing protein n=1 Tax=Adineta steineri TaxID=433720 RepID=A0A820B3N4_9BILA|nr:unnamed protein product [Adineta steineri]CAF4186752.1 unnamed protein product [Adineta steineri]
MIYRPVSLCTFIRNASLPINTSLQSCIWECVYEDRCQTAVYFNDENVCSMFTESCDPNSIQSSGNTRATVICYEKNQGSTIICSSPISPNQAQTATTTITTELTTVPATTTIMTTAVATSTNTMCPIVNCSVISSVQNQGANHPIESLDFSCSSSLSDFSLIQMVQCNHGEKSDGQIETFSPGVTNMSVVQNTSNIIFTWYSLPGQIVDIQGFPYHTQGQLKLQGGGSAHNTTLDTWVMKVRSICGSIANYSGTF